MTKRAEEMDDDLDVMNILKGLPETDTALYFRVDGETGFHYFVGTPESLGETLAALMEQNETIYKAVVHAITVIDE